MAFNSPPIVIQQGFSIAGGRHLDDTEIIDSDMKQPRVASTLRRSVPRQRVKTFRSTLAEADAIQSVQFQAGGTIVLMRDTIVKVFIGPQT